MSFRTFISDKAVSKMDFSIFENFYHLVLPGNIVNVDMFGHWLFEMTYVQKSEWDQAYISHDYETLNDIIISFEDSIIENFVRICRDNLVITEDEDICEIFRSEICNLYVCIFSDYIDSVYSDFETTTIRVFQETYEEADEGIKVF